MRGFKLAISYLQTFSSLHCFHSIVSSDIILLLQCMALAVKGSGCWTMQEQIGSQVVIKYPDPCIFMADTAPKHTWPSVFRGEGHEEEFRASVPSSCWHQGCCVRTATKWYTSGFTSLCQVFLYSPSSSSLAQPFIVYHGAKMIVHAGAWNVTFPSIVNTHTIKRFDPTAASAQTITHAAAHYDPRYF